MEKIAIISDIHGNLPALNKVLEDIQAREINKIICLGDLAGKGPSSAEAIDLIRQHCHTVIKGNWDYYLTEQEGTEMLTWHQKALGKERLSYMRNLPIYVEFYISGNLVRLCHASPNDLFHRVYSNSELEEKLKLFTPTITCEKESDVVGYGDIHGAYIDYFKGKTLFNVGSVGNPIGSTLASYSIIEGVLNAEEPAPFSITIVKVPYDIDEAIKQAEATDMPEKEEYFHELRTGIYRGHVNK